MSEIIPVGMSESQNFLAVIEKVMSSPNASVEMIEKILDVQERILNKQAEIAFNADLSVMLCEIPVIAKTSEIKVQTKSGGNFGVKYASLDEIVEVVRPILSKFGFSVNFEHDQNSSNLVKVSCILRHKQGHSIRNEVILPLDMSGSKNNVQSVGSTITYGKRYSICSILNIATGDDKDGFTVSAEKANAKQTLTEKRFTDALQAVKENKFELYKLCNDYNLTPQQKDAINKEFSHVAEK